MYRLLATSFAVFHACLMSAATPVLAQAPAPGGTSTPTDAQVCELEQQIKSLQQQLDQIKAAPNATARRRLLQQDWQGMQSYMGQMHDRWGMGYPWMAGRPWAMYGPGVTGNGRTSWPVPPSMTAEQYSEQMRARTPQIQEQMNRIA